WVTCAAVFATSVSAIQFSSRTVEEREAAGPLEQHPLVHPLGGAIGLVFGVARRKGIIPWRNRVLATNPVVLSLHLELAAAGILEHVASRILCFPLGWVDAGSPFVPILLVCPGSVRALRDCPIVITSHRDSFRSVLMSGSTMTL